VVLLERLERVLEYGLIRAGSQSVKQFSKTIRMLAFDTQQMRGRIEMEWRYCGTGEQVRMVEELMMTSIKIALIGISSASHYT